MTNQDEQASTQNNTNDTDLPNLVSSDAPEALVVETLDSFSTNSLDTEQQNNPEEEPDADFESQVKALLIDEIGPENYSSVSDSTFFTYEWTIDRSSNNYIHERNTAYVKEFICFSVSDVIITDNRREYKFGDYNIRIEVCREIQTEVTNKKPIRLSEITPYGGWSICVARESGDTEAIHPHVSRLGILCVGDSRRAICDHIYQGNYNFVALIVDQMLRNYSEASPHYRIENFESGSAECQVCGLYKVEYEKIKRNTVCLDCVTDYCTDDFGVKDMPEKMEFCSTCGQKSSTGKFTSSKCDRFLCKQCQTEGNSLPSHSMFPIPTLDESRFNYVGQEDSGLAPF